MKCKDFEMNIYLYAELSAEEKAKLQEHLVSCASCHQLFLSTQHFQTLIQKVADDGPVIRNAALLTHQIMDMTVSAKEPDRRNTLATFFLSRFIKYSFSVVSLLLVMAFSVEFFSEPSKETKAEVSSNASIVLNGALFQETFFKYKEKRKRTALTACFTPLQSSSQVAACLKNQMK